MTDARPTLSSPLERLEQRVAQGLRTLPAARVSGAVVEVSTSHYRVAGLSRFLKLGECVGVDVGDRVEIGEVVRIDDSSATLKPFDTRSDVTIGARAFRAETLSLSPHRRLEGTRHRRARPADRRRGRASERRQVGAARRFAAAAAQARARSCAAAHRRARRRPVHAVMRRTESGRVRRLRRRQVVAPRDAGAGDSDRHGRHCARRRAGPRSAGISSRHAGRESQLRGRGRLDRRRKPDDAQARSEDGDGDRRILPRS